MHDDQRINIAGTRIDNLTMAGALARMEEFIRSGRPRYVFTPNVDHIVRVSRHADFAAAYRDAHLVLADGMPLLWAARYLGTPLKEKVSGSDVLPRFCALAALKGYRPFFLGGRPGAAEKSARHFVAIHPGLQIAGVCCPPMGFEQNEQQMSVLLRQIREARPDVLFVALGTPKQELWIHRYHSACGVPVSIGVGASFDFIAGLQRRAPRLMQGAGLEWLWRLVLEPRRMYRRYLVEDPEFFRLVWSQRVGGGQRRPAHA